MPGMRPPMGGPGHVVPPPAGSGMGVLMPLYTIGIVVFFIYTIMKVRHHLNILTYFNNSIISLPVLFIVFEISCQHSAYRLLIFFFYKTIK